MSGIFKRRNPVDADTPQASHKVNQEVDLSNRMYLKLPDGTVIYVGDNAPQVLQLINDVNILKSNELKILYFESIDISAGTTGTVTLPSGATISLEEFGEDQDAVLSTLSLSGQPLFETPYTSGNAVTVTLDSDGNWESSDVYPDDVAIIYAIKIPFEDFANLDPDNYLPLDETSFQFEKLVNKATTFGTVNNTLFPTIQAVVNYLSGNYQPLSSILSSIAALTGAANDDIIQKKSGEFTYRTPAQVAADLTANLLQGYLGMTINASHSTTNPADSTRYHFGSDPILGASPNANILRIYPTKPCTLKSVFLKTRCTSGSNESVTIGIRKNDTTDTVMGTIDLSASQTNDIFTGLSISFNGTTDYLEIYYDTPAWSSNPTNLRGYANLQFE